MPTPYLAKGWIFLIVIFLWVLPGWAEETLSLVVSDANPILFNVDNTGVLDQLVKETFRRVGVPITITPLPSERALTNANGGIDDGDLLRIGGLSKKYPKLIQVQEKWMDMEFSPFTRKSHVKINTWEDLQSYSFGVIRGWKVFEINTEGMAQRNLVVNADSLFTLLTKDRVDLILYDQLQGMVTIKKKGLTDVFLAGPPLTVEPLYLYMNIKHAALVPRIEAQLREMKQDGSHERLVKDALAAILRP